MLYGIVPVIGDTAQLMQQQPGQDAGGGIGGLLWLIVLVIYLAGMWKVFTKAGQPGWAALIPIFNIYVWLKIIERPWWWLLLLLIPFVNFVVLILMLHDLSKSFGHGLGFTLGLIFLGIIFIPILGFGASQYIGRLRAEAPASAMPA